MDSKPSYAFINALNLVKRAILSEPKLCHLKCGNDCWFTQRIV